MSSLPTRAEIDAAAALVEAVIPRTPQYSWPLLNAHAGCELWVKHENHTPLGAFKVRGGLVYMDELRRLEPGCRGVVCATRGNHGQSVAFAARRHGLEAVVVVPRGNSAEKNAAMRSLGATLIEHGDDFQAALEHARALAVSRDLHAIPSFAPALVRGVAVSAIDFLRHVPPLDTVYVPIGLGSGICAMMAARDALGLATRIVGVCSAHAPAIARSFTAREVIVQPSSTRIADGLACSTPDPTALASILRGTERIVQVTDDEVEAAMRTCFSSTHNTIEGAAAASVAAVLQERALHAGRRIGAVLTGGNVDTAVFARVLGES
ncbi:threonine dehydratase [Horticoccus sp. 23ND18S-11]|uniref:threonine dehydratase n=1 Tax=Horticoccus sp. 23ND18S-11 TaxID=3391832 RepID=UPI0039C9E78B